MSGLQSPDASTRYCNVTTQKHLKFWCLSWWWWPKFILIFFLIILWQEFGDSARARKLYIDDESEEEEELEPNPKLGAGQHADEEGDDNGDEESDGGQHVVQFDGDYVNDDDDCDSHRDNENHMNIVNETLNMVECKQDIASAPNPTVPRRPITSSGR